MPTAYPANTSREQEQRDARLAETHPRQADRLERSEHEAPMESATNPIWCPSRPTKVLISPGTGAGWVTYAPRGVSDAFLVWMLTYEPLIMGLLKGEHKDKLEEILKDFHREAHTKFNVERIMTARVGDIIVEEVSGPFEIREMEGSERIVDVSHRRSIMM